MIAAGKQHVADLETVQVAADVADPQIRIELLALGLPFRSGEREREKKGGRLA